MRAVFLDRDGVLNRNVFYSDTGAFESPRVPEDFDLLPGTMDTLARLTNSGFSLYLVSNQPNVAKGKSTLAELAGAHAKLESAAREAGVPFVEYYYCYHHPASRLEGLGGKCECRKPSPYFLLKAHREYDIDLKQSWMVGDRASDIECGSAAGVRTIRIRPDHLGPDFKAELPRPNFYAEDLREAVDLILAQLPG